MTMMPTQKKILELLNTHASSPSSGWISILISEKCFAMGHLYKDMGFNSRKEMNDLMLEHYPALAEKRPQNIRWKKFLFDTIGEIAPACWQCKDSTDCFSCTILEQSA